MEQMKKTTLMIEDTADVFQGLSTQGRGAGARPGDWRLDMVELTDFRDSCWLNFDNLRNVRVNQGWRTERHLLRPFDVLVAARNNPRAILVPRGISKTVASITILIIRPHNAESGMGHFLWYFLSSTSGKTQMNQRLTNNPIQPLLTAANLKKIQIPIPSTQELNNIVRLVEVSDEAYLTSVEAAQIRRRTLRDTIIGEIYSGKTPKS